MADSLIFKHIDNIAFVILGFVIILTTYAESNYIGYFAMLFSLCMLFKLIVKKDETVQCSLINKILIIYFLIVLISAFGASYFSLSLKGLMKTVIYFCFYFSSAYYLSSNKRKIIPLIILICLTTGLEAIIGIIQNLSHIEAIATWQDTTNITDPTKILSRAYGTLKPYNPNLLAGYLLTGLCSSLGMFLVSNYRKNKIGIILFGALFCTIFYAIFVTGSRGAYLGLFGLFITVLYCIHKYIKNNFGSISKIKAKFKVIFASIIAFCAGIACFIPSFRERFLSVFTLRGDSSIAFRMNVYEACIKMFQDNPFLGIGVGNKNFREIYGLYMKTGYDALGAYSVPLEIAVESGIFALLSFGLFIFLTVKKILHFINSDVIHPIRKFVLFSVLLTIFALMFHGLFDTIFFRPQVQIIFWLNIAIFHSLCYKNKFCYKHN